jgi:hypothetical protein
MRAIAALFMTLACVSGPAWAIDPWEHGLGGSDDFVETATNTVVHGRAQTHDLESEALAFLDIDYMRVPIRDRQSYEARVYSASIRMAVPSGGCGGACADFGRYSSAGALIQNAAAVEGDVLSAAVRWTANTADGFEFLRVASQSGVAGLATDQYTIEVTNTTLFAPRFNNSGTQVTILLLQNTTTTAVGGIVNFWNPLGALLGSLGFSIAPNGSAVFNTSTLPGVGGASGAISVTQNGGYAALTGKAVALEPATGFTFDTPLLPLPR